MEVILWNSLTVLLKVAFYAGFACAFGALFQSRLAQRISHTRDWHRANTIIARAALLGSALNLLLVPIWFLVCTGAMAEEGIEGMLDTDMLEMMWYSSIGDVALLKFIGFSILVALLVIQPKISSNNKLIWDLSYLAGLLILTFSFTLSGHGAELGLLDQILIATHAFVMAWWFGTLLPLIVACKEDSDKELHDVMHRFGQQAMFMVSVLLIAGLYVAIQLVGSFAALLNSGYGQVLLTKLVAVTGIMLIAAYHRFLLVPSLKYENSREKLSKSISIEAVVALAILTITASLTSLVGPES